VRELPPCQEVVAARAGRAARRPSPKSRRRRPHTGQKMLGHSCPILPLAMHVKPLAPLTSSLERAGDLGFDAVLYFDHYPD